jgi:hypothetical protein
MCRRYQPAGALSFLGHYAELMLIFEQDTGLLKHTGLIGVLTRIKELERCSFAQNTHYDAAAQSGNVQRDASEPKTAERGNLQGQLASGIHRHSQDRRELYVPR